MDYNLRCYSGACNPIEVGFILTVCESNFETPKMLDARIISSSSMWNHSITVFTCKLKRQRRIQDFGIKVCRIKIFLRYMASIIPGFGWVHAASQSFGVVFCSVDWLCRNFRCFSYDVVSQIVFDLWVWNYPLVSSVFLYFYCSSCFKKRVI